MDTFSALADPTRRHILELLAKSGELSATDISHRFNVSPAAISQHLKVLKESHLVQVEKRAQQRIYTLNRSGMSDLEKWIQNMTRVWNDRFDALEKVIEKEKSKLNTNSHG